jgi:hypothetical protein
VIVTYSWADASGRRWDWSQILQLRDGMIVDMEDYGRGNPLRRKPKLLKHGRG